MCGIVGIIGLEKYHSDPLVREMNQLIQHRGPDAEGYYIEEGIALGHRRLSIIDLSAGANQPFEDAQQRYVIVFNGEIYNYLEVKQELNYPWTTQSDTEVILAAYSAWGADCLSRLNGMFAFAIWDKEKQEMFIARDRLGVKPLYYCQNEKGFAFSSEIRSLLASQLSEAKINQEVLSEYLQFLTVSTPNTLVKNIFQLCPGHFATLKDGVLSQHQYWNIAQSAMKQELSYAETVQSTHAHFMQAVKSRMVADVKVGAFLSGGIDSSAVVAAMSELSPEPVQTFSIVFNEKEYDESEYSNRIAEKFNCKHHAFLLKPDSLHQYLEPFFKSMDNPSVDGINTYIISKLVAETGIKVVLTGIGGDELFAGYVSFERWKSFQKFAFFFQLPLLRPLSHALVQLKKTRATLKLNDMFKGQDVQLAAFYANSRRVFYDDEIQKLIAKPQQTKKSWIDLNKNYNLPVLSQYSVAELSHYTLDVLMKDTDQMSMAWALEVREPFFDYKMIEFLLGVPDHYKFKKGFPKHLLVEAMGDLLPSEIVHRKKKGFTFPWDYWLRNELKSYCEEAILALSQRGIFEKNGLLELWNHFIQRKEALTWLHVWGLVVLEKWMEENKIKN